MEEMNVNEHQVCAAMFYPEIDSCSRGSTSADQGNSRRALAGDLCVAYFWDGNARVVITVLPRTYEKYQRRDAQS